MSPAVVLAAPAVIAASRALDAATARLQRAIAAAKGPCGVSALATSAHRAELESAEYAARAAYSTWDAVITAEIARLK